MSDAVIDRCQRLVATDPGNALFRFPLGRAFAEAGRWREAIAELTICAEAKADWMAPRILLGRALAEVGDRVGARRRLEEALELALSQGHEEPEQEIRALLSALPPGDAAEHLRT